MDDREPAARDPERVDCVQQFARQKRIMALGLFGLLLLVVILLLVCFFLFEGSPLSSWYPVGIVTIILIMLAFRGFWGTKYAYFAGDWGNSNFALSHRRKGTTRN